MSWFAVLLLAVCGWIGIGALVGGLMAHGARKRRRWTRHVESAVLGVTVHGPYEHHGEYTAPEVVGPNPADIDEAVWISEHYGLRRATTGGYPSGDTKINDLKPPPPNAPELRPAPRPDLPNPGQPAKGRDS